MKVLIASDIHGRLQAAKRLDAIISSFAPERIILLGDYLYNGPRNGVPFDYDPMAVSAIIHKWAPRTVGVKGNCDSRIDQSLLRFHMEDSQTVYLNGYRCDLIHGDLLTGDLIDVQRGDILMFGHTHVPMLKTEDGVTYFNPGSISFPKQGKPASYGIMVNNHLEIKSLDDDTTLAFLDLY